MKYFEAIREAQALMMRKDPGVFICGLGVPDPKGVFGSTLGLKEEFGAKRVFDTPASENGTLGLLLGASLQGMRPIMLNQRVDFFLLALDQLINHAAKWKYMFGGSQEMSVLVRLIVGKGWGQGPQHSQSMHGLFAHIPGLKVAAPATPADIKGLMISALEDGGPTVMIEHRRLYDEAGDVPAGIYRTPFGKARLVTEGRDVTIVASSQMVIESVKAVKALADAGISAELIDLRSLRPLDTATVAASVGKTGRLVVVDGDWGPCGVSGELIAAVAEKDPSVFKSAPVRVVWPDMPCPTSVALEEMFYPAAREIVAAALRTLGKDSSVINVQAGKPALFTGPF
ncbi:MAG: alpha-ketoacid dehydrogenase subunit beta [Candidatus Omnitrophica bacterium]|nr:alpha-ketoacid dehydrogenase subunit beta [Candidatus Omnitrophota bacterium]